MVRDDEINATALERLVSSGSVGQLREGEKGEGKSLIDIKSGTSDGID